MDWFLYDNDLRHEIVKRKKGIFKYNELGTDWFGKVLTHPVPCISESWNKN